MMTAAKRVIFMCLCVQAKRTNPFRQLCLVWCVHVADVRLAILQPPEQVGQIVGVEVVGPNGRPIRFKFARFQIGRFKQTRQPGAGVVIDPAVDGVQKFVDPINRFQSVDR